jgi:peptidoglycan-associated lipoprotein
MEATMNGYSSHAYAFGAIVALGMLAGCAQEATAPPQAAAVATPAPQLAGAWYQVQFDSNKSDIDAHGRMIVDTVANVVTHNAATRVTVIGKTDRVGSATANLALSQRRADQVRDALITAGVPAARIDTRWTGEGKQDVATGDQVAEQRNRVVDITVVQETR